jgi:hypothetical protein
MAASSRFALLGLLLVGVPALLIGCTEEERSFAQFDGPVDVAVLEPGIFEVPVALVTSFRSGRVTKLDLKRTTVLVEDSPAPWMPGPDIAFGANRALGEIALVEGADFVDVWVSDDFRDELLRAPWIDGFDEDGKPAWVRPGWSEVTFHDVDGTVLESEAVPELRGLRVRPGRATTETWTMTWRGNAFEVEGSASGLQNLKAVPGTWYESDAGEIAFVAALAGLPMLEGQALRFETASGVEAADAGGLVTDLLVSPDGDWIFASIIPDDGPGWVSVWDAEGFVEIDRLQLPAGSAPERLAAGRDEGVVWIADSIELPDGSGRLFRLDFVPGDVATLATTELHAPEPLIDLADGRDPDAHFLFAAGAYTDAIWTLDPVTGAAQDINPFTPEVDATHVRSVISGLTAIPRPVETGELDQDGSRFAVYGVLATTFAGEMYWLNAGTGCQVFGGPARAYLNVVGDIVNAVWSDIGYESNPQLVYDDASERVISTHPCGGITRTEQWTFRYDEQLQSYEVEGTRSGLQANRAFEGVRYFSDNGSISLLIMPGTLPTTDGDRFSFPVNDGVTPVRVHELPGDPVVFTELYDDRTGSWFEVKEREIALIPHTGNDVLMWVDIQGQGQNDAGLRYFQ